MHHSISATDIKEAMDAAEAQHKTTMQHPQHSIALSAFASFGAPQPPQAPELMSMIQGLVVSTQQQKQTSAKQAQSSAKQAAFLQQRMADTRDARKLEQLKQVYEEYSGRQLIWNAEDTEGKLEQLKDAYEELTGRQLVGWDEHRRPTKVTTSSIRINSTKTRRLLSTPNSPTKARTATMTASLPR